MGANSGAFKPGQSGNPGGRPKGAERLVREAATGDLTKMVEMQISLAKGLIPEGTQIKELNARDVTRAFNAILDRGWGRPKQVLEVGASDERDDNLPDLTDEQLEALAAMDANLPEAPADDGDLDAGT